MVNRSLHSLNVCLSGKLHSIDKYRVPANGRGITLNPFRSFSFCHPLFWLCSFTCFLVSEMESRHFSETRHLPRHRCEDIRRAKTLSIRLRRDSDAVKMFETDTARVQLSRHIIAIKRQQLLKQPFYGKQVNSE